MKSHLKLTAGIISTVLALSTMSAPVCTAETASPRRSAAVVVKTETVTTTAIVTTTTNTPVTTTYPIEESTEAPATTTTTTWEVESVHHPVIIDTFINGSTETIADNEQCVIAVHNGNLDDIVVTYENSSMLDILVSTNSASLTFRPKALGTAHIHVFVPMTGFEKDYTITVVPNPHRGDANTDGEVTLADAILIMQVIANPDKYDTEGSDPNHITPYGKGNADVNGSLGYSDIHDGLTVKDALDIQMYMLGLIDSLNSWLLDK